MNEGQERRQDSSVAVESPTHVIARVNIGPFMLAQPKPAQPRPDNKK